MRSTLLFMVYFLATSNSALAVECKAIKSVNGSNLPSSDLTMRKMSINRGTSAAQAGFSGEDTRYKVQIFVSDVSSGSTNNMVSISITDKTTNAEAFSLGAFDSDGRFVTQILDRKNGVVAPFITISCDKGQANERQGSPAPNASRR